MKQLSWIRIQELSTTRNILFFPKANCQTFPHLYHMQLHLCKHARSRRAYREILCLDHQRWNQAQTQRSLKLDQGSVRGTRWRKPPTLWPKEPENYKTALRQVVGGGGYSGHEHKSSGTAGLSERRDVCLFIEKLVNEEEEIVALAFIFQTCWN